MEFKISDFVMELCLLIDLLSPQLDTLASIYNTT